MQNLHLAFRPRNIHGVYGINYYFEDSNGSKNRIQFEAVVRYCGQYLNDYAIYHLTKGEFVVNRNESDEYLYDIAKKCASVLYPVAILVDRKGNIVYVHPSDRKKEWMEMRAELDRYYKGPTAEDYLYKIENQLDSTDVYNKMIHTDPFFSQLFSVRYGNHDADAEFNRSVGYVPFTSPLNVTFKQEIDFDVDDDTVNYFRVYQKGATETAYKYGTVYQEQGLDPKQYNSEVSATLDVSYELDKNSFLLEAIGGDYVVKVDGRQFSGMRMEAYRLYEKPAGIGVDTYFQKLEKEHLRKENSFSGRLKRFFND